MQSWTERAQTVLFVGALVAGFAWFLRATGTRAVTLLPFPPSSLGVGPILLPPGVAASIQSSAIIAVAFLLADYVEGVSLWGLVISDLSA